MNTNYLIKLLIFILFLNLVGNISKNILYTDELKCHKINITTTDIIVSNHNYNNTVLSVFYKCDNNDIKQYYVMDNVFMDNPYKNNFTVYKNLFGSSLSFGQNFLGSLISWIIFSPIFFNIIRWGWNIIMNY